MAQDQLNFLVTKPLLIIFPPCSIPYHTRLHLMRKSQKCYIVLSKPSVFMSHAIPYCGPGSIVGIVTSYGLDSVGIKSRWEQDFLHLSRLALGPPSLLYDGYRVFPRGKERLGVMLTPHPLLVPWSRKSRAIPLLPLWTVQPVQSLSACTRVHFTLPYLTEYWKCEMKSHFSNKCFSLQKQLLP